MRSAITAMQQTTKQIFEDQSLVNVEEKMATVKEVGPGSGVPHTYKSEPKKSYTRFSPPLP